MNKPFIALLFLVMLSTIVTASDDAVSGGVMDGLGVYESFNLARLSVFPEKAISSDKNFYQEITVKNEYSAPLYFFFDSHFNNELVMIKTVDGTTFNSDDAVKSDTEYGYATGLVSSIDSVSGTSWGYTKWGDANHYLTLKGVLLQPSEEYVFPINYTTVDGEGKFNVSIWASVNDEWTDVLDTNKQTVFHYTLDPTYISLANGTGSSLDVGSTSTFDFQVAQPFNVTCDTAMCEVLSVVVAMDRQGTPVDSVQLSLQGFIGKPDGNTVSDSIKTVLGMDIPTSISNITFNYSTPVLIANGTDYVVFIERTGAVNGVNYTRVRHTGIGGGRSIQKDGSSNDWPNQTGTGAIQLYIQNNLGVPNYTITVYNTSWVTPVFESSLNNFTINLSWAMNISNVTRDSVLVNLTYNNTVYTPSVLTNGTDNGNNSWAVFNVSGVVAPLIFLNGTNISFNWTFYSVSSNGTNQLNVSSTNSQMIMKIPQFITVNYTGNVTNGTSIFARNLSMNVSFNCFSTINSELIRHVNGVFESSQNVTCSNITNSTSANYVSSTEGIFVINYTLNSSSFGNISSPNVSFISDLNPPTITNLSFVPKDEVFNVTLDFNVIMICADTMYSPLNYTLIVNNNTLFNNTVSNNTIQTNSTNLISGENNLTGICADGFGNVSAVESRELIARTLALIDEVNNIDLDVTNLSGVRVYLDSNRTFFDFKSANVSSINFTSINETGLRFELIYVGGVTVTRYVDTAVATDSTLRVCGNLEGVTHFEQIITSSILRAVSMISIFSDCYVAADYTRFAYQDKKALKAFTIQVPYYLNTVVDGQQTLLSNVDGSIQTEINLDTLELIATPYDFSIIQSALTFQHTGTNQVTIFYRNDNDDNTAGNLTIRNVDNNTLIFTTSTFTDYNSWNYVFDYTTTNLSNSTMFQITYVTNTTSGVERTVRSYFNGRGADGLILNSIAAIVAIFMLIFGLSITTVRITFSWFGIVICLATFVVLTFATGGVWYITFLQAVTMIVLVYIIINMIKQGGETLT